MRLASHCGDAAGLHIGDKLLNHLHQLRKLWVRGIKGVTKKENLTKEFKLGNFTRIQKGQLTTFEGTQVQSYVTLAKQVSIGGQTIELLDSQVANLNFNFNTCRLIKLQ